LTKSIIFQGFTVRRTELRISLDMTNGFGEYFITNEIFGKHPAGMFHKMLC